MVRQVEDEIGVATMAIGAAATGARAMCATSGGGFALMTEAVGSAAMMEIPVVMINVMRAGPSTGVPTKTEQGDLWQMLGASQGDFPRIIVAPKDVLDAYNAVIEGQVYRHGYKFFRLRHERSRRCGHHGLWIDRHYKCRDEVRGEQKSKPAHHPVRQFPVLQRHR